MLSGAFEPLEGVLTIVLLPITCAVDEESDRPFAPAIATNLVRRQRVEPHFVLSALVQSVEVE